VFSIVIELPSSELGPKPEIHIWGAIERTAMASCATSIERATLALAAFSTQTTPRKNTMRASQLPTANVGSTNSYT